MSAAVAADQPGPHSSSCSCFGRSSTESSLRRTKTAKTKTKSPSLRFAFFNRPRNQSDASSRKLLISAPTDFRHLTSGSQHAFPAMPLSMHPLVAEVPPIPQAPGFLVDSAHSPEPPRVWSPETHRDNLTTLRPLEQIYRTQNRLSPLLPFELPIMMPSPPPAYSSDESEQYSVPRAQRSLPAMYHAPRRTALDSLPSSPLDVDLSSTTPASPASQTSAAPSSPGSPAYTTARRDSGSSRPEATAEVQAIRNRVANAMLEVERLQKKIDDVVERQSLYVPSRPGSAHSSYSLPRTLPDPEPMPSVPALPPSAPSFAERLHGETDRLATTSYSLPLRGSSRNVTGLPPSRNQRKTPQVATVYDNSTETMPPPPLPLVLRPPLRKKKPFSEGLVSLGFPEKPRKRDSRRESITNKPLPIRSTDGFYQCVTLNGQSLSYESLNSLSMSDDGGNSEARSPNSVYSPTTPRDMAIERWATFGQDEKELSLAVGVAL